MLTINFGSCTTISIDSGNAREFRALKVSRREHAGHDRPRTLPVLCTESKHFLSWTTTLQMFQFVHNRGYRKVTLHLVLMYCHTPFQCCQSVKYVRSHMKKIPCDANRKKMQSYAQVWESKHFRRMERDVDVQLVLHKTTKRMLYIQHTHSKLCNLHSCV